MAAALYWWRATWRAIWRPTLVVILMTGILGAVALAALAGARRTESAYGRYLGSINASDVLVNIPAPGTSLIAKVSALPGVRASAAYVGLNANPVVHGRVDDSFVTDALTGSLSGEIFTQDKMTVLKGRMPRLDATNQIALTAGLARLFGVGVGGKVTYQFENAASPVTEVTGSTTYRVVGIVDVPPVLVDQFDQVQTAILPPAATAAASRHLNSVPFSWVGLRLTKGSEGIPALQTRLDQLAARLGGGLHFAVRQLDTVHRQVQDAIEPQAVALGTFGGLVALAMLVLVSQGLRQLLERSASQLELLRALGMTRGEAALAGGMGGAAAVIAGMALAVAGAVALSPLAPVGPVRQFDPQRGVSFDFTVLFGGGLLLTAVLLGFAAWLAWRTLRSVDEPREARPSALAQAAVSVGLPTSAMLGIQYALEPPPGHRRGAVRANLVASIVAVTSVIAAVIFGASLNGLVAHPVRYGWTWDVLIQSQGGYGDWYGYNMDKLMAAQPGVRGWSAFGFTQVPIDDQSIPVLGMTTHGTPVEPPTVSGHPIEGPDDIELGVNSLRQLGKTVGDHVVVGTGPTARRMTIVGTVTLPSIGVALADHVSLGVGAMLPESTLLSIEGFNSVGSSAASGAAFTALPSTLAIDLDPGARAGPLVHRILAADPDDTPGGMYQVHRVLAAAIANDAQMGDQPLTLAVVLAVAMVLSLLATVQASTHRRQRELAIMRALGFTRRQVRAVIVWQTSTILVIAATLGLALGSVAGHWVWTNFATSIGVVPITVIPFAALVVGLLILLVAGNAMSALPAELAARAPTSTTLRAE